MRHLLPAILLVPLSLGGCISTQLNDTWSAPDFSWDTLKRDEILMTPLLDLRPVHKPDFYSEKESLSYAETFKQAFFKLRKDIRIFGAGGAFENIASFRHLDAIGRAAFARTPLAPVELSAIRASNQGIRFLMVFGVTRESLTKTVEYQFRDDQPNDVIHYVSSRSLDVQMALWDALQNKTQWIGKKIAGTAADNVISVANPAKRKVKKERNGKVYFVWEGPPLSISSAYELQSHPDRFPDFPPRNGLLESTFDDLALGFPIQSSEEKLIVYSYFTYHRPELGVGLTAIGKEKTGYFQAGSSSIINNLFRLGGMLSVSGSPEIAFKGETYNVGMAAFGVTTDLEWPLTDRMRVLIGTFLGSASFNIKSTRDADTNANNGAAERAGDSDLTLAVWPRVRLNMGAQKGIQWGTDLTFHWFNGIEAPILLEHKPAPLALEMFVAYAMRGF